MTWRVDFTDQARADVVGLDTEVSAEITDMLLAWMASGPPRENERVLAGITFYESEIAGRYLLGYSTKEDPPAFVVLWPRQKPGS